MPNIPRRPRGRQKAAQPPRYPVEWFERSVWSRLKPDGDCLRWTGAHLPTGRGKVRLPALEGRKTAQPHRVVYEQLVGPIPDGAELDHVHVRGCRFVDCCRPDHLEPVDRLTNQQRHGDTITHCPKGHEYTDANTYRRTKGNGRKQCRTCHREEQAAYRARNRAAA